MILTDGDVALRVLAHDDGFELSVVQEPVEEVHDSPELLLGVVRLVVDVGVDAGDLLAVHPKEAGLTEALQPGVVGGVKVDALPCCCCCCCAYIAIRVLRLNLYFKMLESFFTYLPWLAQSVWSSQSFLNSQ